MKTNMSMQRAPRRRGLTLIELLLATAGTGFVATAIAMMLNAISFGTSTGTDLRQAVVKQKTITSRITSAIRSSYLVLAAEDDLLILWTNDDNGDGEPSLGEIRRIERDAASKEIRAYAAPSDLSSGNDTSYTLASTNFASVTEALRDTANFPEEVWATGISTWTISLDADLIQDAMLISSRLTVDVGDFHETAIATAALRNQGTTSFTASDVTEENEEVVDGGGDGGSGGGSSKSKGKGKSKGKSSHNDDDDDNSGKGNDDDDDHHDDDDDNNGKGNDNDDDHHDDDDDNGKGNDNDDDHGGDNDDDSNGKGKGNDDDDN